jgi:hypothetical protein
LRLFPKLSEPLTKEQQAQLDAMLGTKVLEATDTSFRSDIAPKHLQG